MQRSLRRDGVGPASLLAPCLLAAVLMLTAACSNAHPGSPPAAGSAVHSAVTSSTAEVQVAKLASHYGLRFAGDPESIETTLEPPDEFAAGDFSSSEEIGLDLASHVGERVEIWTYALTDRSTADSTITADFFVSGDSVVGAVLRVNSKDLAGWGTASISDHDFFAPPGGVLTADHLVFSGVQSIEMWGPRPKSHRTVRDAAQISKVLSLIGKSKRRKDPDIAYAESEYWLHLRHTNGAVTDVDLNRSKADKSLYICFSGHGPADLYLRPAPGLTAYLDQLLKTGR